MADVFCGLPQSFQANIGVVQSPIGLPNDSYPMGFFDRQPAILLVLPPDGSESLNMLIISQYLRNLKLDRKNIPLKFAPLPYF
jgi:hypothetical protein